MKSDEIDDAIERVIRQIMRTEPRAGLRARVMGQLSTPGRPRVFTQPRLAVAAVFVACVVAGLFVRDYTRSGEQPVRNPDVAVVTPPAPPVVTPPAAAPVPETPARRTAPPSVVARSRVTALEDRVVSATSLEETDLTVSIAPMTPLVAIDAPPLADSPVSITEIAIRPLEVMDPVRVDLLSSMPR